MLTLATATKPGSDGGNRPSAVCRGDRTAGELTGATYATSRPEGGVRAGCLPRVGPTTAGWNAVAALASAMAGVTPFPFAGRTGRAARPEGRAWRPTGSRPVGSRLSKL